MTEQNSKIGQNPDALNTCQHIIYKSLRGFIDEWMMQEFTLSDLPELISAINSNDRFKQGYGVIGVKKLLSVQNVSIQKIIHENLVPKLIELMQNTNEPQLQLESAQALSEIACRGTAEQIQVIIDNGGLPIFVELLKSPREDIIAEAIWAIGMVVGESVSFRDELLKLGALELLLQIANKIKEQHVLKNCVFAISYLCRGKHRPSLDIIKSATPTLYRILQTDADADILFYSTMALLFLSEKERTIDYSLAKGVISALLKYINGPYVETQIALIRILKHITFDDTVQTIALEDSQYLPTLFTLTCNLDVHIRRESCWAISNITARDTKQIKAIIDNPYYVDILIKISTSDVRQVQKLALRALVNPIDNLSPKQLAELIDLGVLDCFLYLVDSDEDEIVELAACGVSEVVNKGVQIDQVGRVANEFRDIIIHKNGVEKVKELGHHPNEEVKSMALEILETHFEIRIQQEELYDF